MRRVLAPVLAVSAVILFTIPLLRAEDLSPEAERLTRHIVPSVIEWRRDIHSQPELGNREQRTARIVAERLKAIGVDQLKTGVAGHGVVALIHGARPGPTVALRADMDALPIQEATRLPFASRNDGVMHACGHDSHTAMLLGAAQVLVQLKEHLPGNVKLIFQPAEEGTPPGERGGAGLMIEEGVLSNPEVAAIFGLHVNAEYDTGKLISRPGTLMASADRFRVTVIGKQSHGAMPWQGIDPIVTSAQMITALQTIRSRRLDARRPAVISVGMIQGGSAWNIIPERVTFAGTIRTFDAEVRSQVMEELTRIVTETAAAFGAKAEVELSEYGPPTRNDPKLFDEMKTTLARLAGENNVIESEPLMGSEDFALYAQKIPAMFVFLGVHDPASQTRYAIHSPTFVLDENALPLGVRTLVMLAVDYLQSQ